MGKLIVIEGIDGSGKGTQSLCLQERLTEENYNWYGLSFPQYDSESSYFVRQYLSGMYGSTAAEISPKQASLCYAMDRFNTFKANHLVKEALENPDTILLANRYTTSNILYQASKASSLAEIYELTDWICDLEYNVLQIPKPDMIIMPHIEIEKNIELMTRRDIAENAKNNNMSTDIHERDFDYLRHVSEISLIIADRLGFDVIDCMTTSGELKSIEEIHEDIYAKVNQKVLKYVNKKN